MGSKPNIIGGGRTLSSRVELFVGNHEPIIIATPRMRVLRTSEPHQGHVSFMARPGGKEQEP